MKTTILQGAPRAAVAGGSSGASTVSATSMNGVVAIGDALAQANITVLDAMGKTAVTTSNDSGIYTVSLSGLTAPLLIVANDPSGINFPMYSVVASTTQSGSSAGQPLVANVTPLTTAVSAELTSDGNPSDLSASGALGKMVTSAGISTGVSKLDAVLANLLSQNGLSAQSFDPIGGAFTANHTGADAVIDSISVTPAPGGGLQITSIANLAQSVALNLNMSTATVLSQPPFPIGYLSTLLTQLTQCFGGTASSCSSAIDAGYMENGVNSFTTEHSLIAEPGTTITGVTTLAFYPGGTFPNVSGESALVHIKYTEASGALNYSTTLVQHLSSGNWDIVGNQVQYDITVSTFLRLLQYLDAKDESYDLYDTGLTVGIPTASPNPGTMASASVTGPGINGTAWMEPRNAVGNSTLSFTSDPLSAAPTGGATTNANTSLYRWSWQLLQAGSTFTPTSMGYYYGTTPIQPASLPVPYSTYTVTLYDSSGSKIGSPQTVIDTTPPLTASAGSGVLWQQLSPATESAFLNPSGSLAGSQASVSINWTTDSNLEPEVTNIEVQGYPGTGQNSSEVDGWWPGPATLESTGNYTETATAGMNQNGVQACSSTPCPFPALVSGGTRNIELKWSSHGVGLLNQYNYDD
jgi:hypothetical protein